MILFLRIPAKLLRQGHHHRVPEKDRDLLQAAHRRQRRDYLRLQVPSGGEQDPLPVWDGKLPRDAQLVQALLSLTCQRPAKPRDPRCFPPPQSLAPNNPPPPPHLRGSPF